MNRLLIALLIGLAGSGEVLGQLDAYQEIAATRSTRSKVYHEAFALPGDPGAALVAVAFRIPNDRLVFMRHAEGLDDRLFRASVTVTVELHQGEKIVEEKIWRSESFASNYDVTVDPLQGTTGSVAFSAKPGQYAIRVRLSDQNTQRSTSTPLHPLTVPDFSETQVGKALIADSVVTTSPARHLTLLNLGGDARYGRNAFAVVPVSIGPDDAGKAFALRWTLRKIEEDAVRKELEARRRQRASVRRPTDPDDEPEAIELRTDFEGGTLVESGRIESANLLSLQSLKPIDIHDNTITLVDPAGGSTAYLAVIDLNGRQLENGVYLLTSRLEGGVESSESTTRFATHWPDMPTSLLDVDVAIKNMRFILDRAAVDRLKSGSREDKINNFKDFWSGRDPTPETAFNELMVEYFRRVDYAALEYRTGPGMIPNGLETDRARIYIVHGPPDDVSRSFPEGGGVLEIWVYSDGKRFTFESVSSIDPFHIVREG